MTKDGQKSLTQQLLNLIKQMLNHAKFFALSVTMENFNFSASSQKMEQPFYTIGKKKIKKSPSQKKMTKLERRSFLKIIWNSPILKTLLNLKRYYYHVKVVIM